MAALVAVLATGATAQQEKADKVDIRGVITNVRAAEAEAKKQGTLGWIRVEGVKEKDTAYDKASVRITDKTRIEKLAGKEKKAAAFGELKQGVRVQAVFTGPVAESYPVQATAKEVLIVQQAQ
jgi:beta-N-acetylhexosaminidase